MATLKTYTLYGYECWAVRPLGACSMDEAKASCRALLVDSEYDCVRAIDDDSGRCVASFDRDDDGQIVDRSDITS